jgi:hypothetical protein
MGKYKEFYELYKDFMTPEILDIYDRTVEYSQAYDESKHLHILNRKYIYLDLTGVYDIPTYQSVIDDLNVKIQENL